MEALVQMGFEEKLSGVALRQTNNDYSAAVEVLTTNPQILMPLIKTPPPLPGLYSEELIQNILAMGFTREQAIGTLKKSGGDGEAAVNLLLSGEGDVFDGEMDMDIEGEGEDDEVPFDDPLLDNPVPVVEETPEQKQKRLEEEKERKIKYEAEMDLVDTLAERNEAGDPDAAAFDLELEEESNILETYLGFLEGRK